MAMDIIESISNIPNNTDNFDELWMVVSRTNGRNIEIMTPKVITVTDSNGDEVVLREDQIRLDS